jgi:hypothetical protein
MTHLEEVVEHVVMVALRMISGQVYVLVHVEGLDVLERNLPGQTVFDLGSIYLFTVFLYNGSCLM